MSRPNAVLLAILVSLATPAFSAERAAGTTIDAPAAAVPDPRDDIDPATGLARTTVVKPLTDVPAVRDAPRAAQPARAHIALILPTSSPALGRLADAVRQGFAAAAAAAGKEALPVILTAIDNESTALPGACAAAQAAGAAIVVAAITRDGASTLAKSDCARRPVLALNDPQAAPSELPPNLYTVSLSLENEARQVALLATDNAGNSAVVISSGSPLSKRVQEAFEREWTRDAGQVAARIVFTGGPDDAPLIRERLAAVRADLVFLALDQPEARLVRPYISGMLPLYATSMSVNPRAEAVVNVDLQGLRYVEMPWFVQPDHPAVMVYPQPRTMSVEEERLYAFGIDAFRIAGELTRSERHFPIDGVTGKITLEGSHFNRALTAAEVDGGRVIPLRAP
ncbi:MAG TPA: penicillin-binding protein activator [Usitatibacter sp.]|nr:penicillin-binding protein activator [Usitatibacter sp.]